VRAFAEWLSRTPPSVAIQSTFWLIRVLQGTHLLTAGVAAVSGVLILLRVLGLYRVDEPFATVRRRFAPWLAAGLTIMVATGIAQTLGDPVREFTATSYWVKIALVACCTIGTARLARDARGSPPAATFSARGKVVAGALILCWLAIALLGRMIAYDQAIWGSLSLRT
jgi:hypothetical protein